MTDTQTTTRIPSPPTTNRLEPTVRTVTVVDAPPAPAATPQRAVVGLLVTIVLLGSGARLAAMFYERCLWLDEAMLALNLVERTPRQLFDPLDWNQGAPVGFLLAVKGAISAFGTSEWAFRLVPFAAALASLAGFAWVSRRLMPAHAALIATALMALSPYLISYAAECKQYGCDAAIAIGLLAVSLGLLQGKGGALRWTGLAVAGAMAVWCSHPATFILGGIGSALLIHAAVEKDRKRLLAAGLTVGCWLVSFGACYLICLKQLGSNKYLTDYWTDHFMPLAASPGTLSWIADHIISFFTQPGGIGGPLVPLGGFAAFLALVGTREFVRERWPVAVALVGPVLFLLAASGVQKYPFGGRLLLFLVPFATILVARGAAALYDATRNYNRFAAVALLVLLVGASAWETFDVLKRPMRREQIAPVLEQVRKEMKPGDKVFVYYSAVPAYQFYTRGNPLPAADATFGVESRDNPEAYRKEVQALHGRVWVIFSHPHKHEETLLKTMLGDRAPCERAIRDTGAAAWLHDMK